MTGARSLAPWLTSGAAQDIRVGQYILIGSELMFPPRPHPRARPNP